MLLRPSVGDLRGVGFYTGRVLTGVGLAMLAPAALAAVLGERADLHGFLLGAALAISTGRITDLTLRPARRNLSVSQGLATVALAWLTAPLFAAVPLLLSGHYASYLDAYFEAMSGFATIGLTLANDLDHMARSVNFWRHLMQFVGGQGIIVVVLTLFVGGGRVGILYTGEGREEKILPNVVHTARFIWRVAFAYALIGISALWASLVSAGLSPLAALYHATNLFMAAFDTGGFAVQSTSAAFYRSAVVEAVLLVVMTAGAFSFALHYHLWQRRRLELVRNLETRTIALSTLAVFTIMVVGLARSGAMTEYGGMLRHGLFQTISAHTTTGLATVPGAFFLGDWGALAPAMLVTAMALGGMAGSTAGGIKGIRIGLLAKSLAHDIRRVLLPPDAVVVTRYHSGNVRLLEARHVRAAVTVLLLWLGLYFAGAMLALAYGYDLQVALFDSVAAASSGGLSVGLARPGMETPIKVVMIAQMVLGRLEFVALFALAGYVVALLRGKP